MIRSRTLLVALVATFTALVATSRAETDLELAPKATALGTILPAGERDLFRIPGADDALLSFTLTSKDDSLGDLRVELRDPGWGVLLDIESFPGFSSTGDRVTLKKFPLLTNGTHRLQVFGAGTGEYALKVKVAYRKKFAESLMVDAGSSRGFGIGAIPHSKVTVSAVAPKGSAAVPRFDELFDQDVSAQGKITDRSHKVTIDDIGSGAKFGVDVRNAGVGPGEIVVKVTVTPPKAKKDKLDARGIATGSPDGGELVISRTVEPDGDLEIADCGVGPAAGGGLVVDEGSVTEPVRLTVSTTAAPMLPNPETHLQAGPALLYTPKGQRFEKPVGLRLPYEAWRIPVDADVDHDLSVLRVGADGSTEILTPSAVQGGRVHIDVDGFSTYMPIVAKGRPNPENSEFWGVGFSLAIVPDMGGVDTGMRVISSSYARTRLDSSSEFRAEGEARSVTFSHDRDGVGSVAVEVFDDLVLTGEWEMDGPQGEVAVRIPGRPEGFVFPNENGTAYVREVRDDGSTPSVTMEVLLRRPRFDPRIETVAGKYWLGMLEAIAEIDGPNRGVNTLLTRGFGTLVLTSKGTWKLQLDLRGIEFEPGPQEENTIKERVRAKGSYRIEDEGILAGSLVLSGPDVPALRAFPGPGADAFVGTMDVHEGRDGAVLYVAVRQSRIRDLGVLSGPFVGSDVRAAPTTYAIPSGTVGDWALFEDTDLGTIDGPARTRNRTRNRTREVFRRAGGDIAVVVGANDPPSTVPFTLDRKGRLTFVRDTSRHVGAVTTDGRFGFRLRDPKKDDGEVFGLEVFVKSWQD